MMLCKDRCGAEVADEDAGLRAGWTWLAIAGGWRCPACVRLLLAVSALEGTPPDPAFRDPLPPGSRGALPRATVQTITLPAVRP